ncbi:hypothetical protein E2493_15720 [Sphingomonas parva]|uniref:Uncharacterized protein n=1 Tax=Sphingomonas parva TaxID=2555898 RepID=A0A4Y8ZPX4_9SPHN|nr:hypothetical protein [Sphingomonas parva]TFI57312.1 hypothetical protein E2493_15720 [Sphingomonas parva]
MPIRLAVPLLLAIAPAAAFAQAPADPVAAALETIARHQVSTRVGCPIPVPALWNAPPYEQQAAWRRREAFEECLNAAMEREGVRLQQLSAEVQAMQSADPDGDWVSVSDALDAKWAELETLQSKLASRQNWANTAVNILDTFTGPGAPFDTSRPAPSYSPYGPYMVPAPGGGYYRRDTSVSAPGIK